MVIIFTPTKILTLVPLIPTLIPRIATTVPHIPTLIPRIPIIPILIPCIPIHSHPDFPHSYHSSHFVPWFSIPTFIDIHTFAKEDKILSNSNIYWLLYRES